VGGASGSAWAPLPCGLTELRALAERLAPEPLFPPAARARLRAIPDPLPPVACAGALECRLEAGARQVDLEVCFRGAPQTRRRLAEALAGPARGVPADPRWQRALSVLRAWSEPAHPGARWVAAAWLELDAPPGAPGPPAPFAVLTLDPEGGVAGGRIDRRWLQRAAGGALELLAGGPTSLDGVGMAALLRALPPSAQLLHLALRPAGPEGDATLRAVTRLPWRGLPGLLARLDWPGSLPELQMLLERLCSRTLVHSVNLDLGPRGAGPRVGIEFHFPTYLEADPRWCGLFDALEAAGACAPAARRALAAWTRPRTEALPPGSIKVHRELLVKVVHRPGAPLRAKAYLAFAPRLLGL